MTDRIERYAGLGRREITAHRRGFDGTPPRIGEELRRQYPVRSMYVELGYKLYARLRKQSRSINDPENYQYMVNNVYPLMDKLYDHIARSRCWGDFDHNCARKASKIISEIRRVLDRADKGLGRTWGDWVKRIWRKLGGR